MLREKYNFSAKLQNLQQILPYTPTANKDRETKSHSMNPSDNALANFPDRYFIRKQVK